MIEEESRWSGANLRCADFTGATITDSNSSLKEALLKINDELDGDKKIQYLSSAIFSKEDTKLMEECKGEGKSEEIHKEILKKRKDYSGFHRSEARE